MGCGASSDHEPRHAPESEIQLRYARELEASQRRASPAAGFGRADATTGSHALRGRYAVGAASLSLPTAGSMSLPGSQQPWVPGSSGRGLGGSPSLQGSQSLSVSQRQSLQQQQQRQSLLGPRLPGAAMPMPAILPAVPQQQQQRHQQQRATSPTTTTMMVTTPGRPSPPRSSRESPPRQPSPGNSLGLNTSLGPFGGSASGRRFPPQPQLQLSRDRDSFLAGGPSSLPSMLVPVMPPASLSPRAAPAAAANKPSNLLCASGGGGVGVVGSSFLTATGGGAGSQAWDDRPRMLSGIAFIESRSCSNVYFPPDTMRSGSCAVRASADWSALTSPGAAGRAAGAAAAMTTLPATDTRSLAPRPAGVVVASGCK